MRPALLPALLAVALLALAGCASDEYSKMPDPTGEWVPANPPSLVAGGGLPQPLATATEVRR